MSDYNIVSITNPILDFQKECQHFHVITWVSVLSIFSVISLYMLINIITISHNVSKSYLGNIWHVLVQNIQ